MLKKCPQFKIIWNQKICTHMCTAYAVRKPKLRRFSFGQITWSYAETDQEMNPKKWIINEFERKSVLFKLKILTRFPDSSDNPLYPTVGFPARHMHAVWLPILIWRLNVWVKRKACRFWLVFQLKSFRKSRSNQSQTCQTHQSIKRSKPSAKYF